ncbi:hypothetical protein ACQP2U_23450 [Nocardia sp. CA-084685]|uniref:hypothetical protein n=1 Tax=Nocardia sp. CA-084685 TaxID=3239970 RepID=UPI003D99211A
MPTLITRHEVHNFDAWRQVFARHQDNRRAHGATGHRIYRAGNDVTVLTDFSTHKALDNFLADPALRDVIARAGFAAPPTTLIVDLVDSEQY